MLETATREHDQAVVLVTHDPARPRTPTASCSSPTVDRARRRPHRRVDPVGDGPRSGRSPMIRLTLRELRVAPAQHIATLIVTTLGAVLATIVIETNQVLASQSVAGGFTRHGFVRLLLDVLGSVFLFVAIFVSCIVIANTFGIVMASRSKRIALLRLLGAEGRVLRRGVALEGVVVGARRRSVGTLLGLAVAAGLVVLLTNAGTFVPPRRPSGHRC